MIIVSSSVIGISLKKGCRCRVDNLKAFITSFQLIKSEIIFKKSSLDELIVLLEKSVENRISNFFKKALCSSKYENINDIIPMLKELNLKDNDIKDISNALSVLGSYDTRSLSDLLELSIERLKGCLIEAEECMQKNGKLYTVIGVMSGLLISLILL